VIPPVIRVGSGFLAGPQGAAKNFCKKILGKNWGFERLIENIGKEKKRYD
jgi:hypothetical protein